jgi:hypothetical protein
MKSKYTAFTAIAAALLLLAACGSGGLGSILNGPQSSSYPGTGSTDIYGTVNSVDTNGQRINVAVNDYNGQHNMWVPYDSRTQVTYQGQYGSPTQLERGDQISIRMRSNGVADLVTVTQSVSAGTYPNQYPPSNTNPYPSSQATGRVQGTVNYVDAQNQLIQLSTSYVNGLRNTQSSNYTLYYDSRTRVMYQGNSNYTPADLERGDQIDATTFNSGNGQVFADTITVTRNVRQ